VSVRHGEEWRAPSDLLLTTAIRWRITFLYIESGPQIHDSVAEVGYGV
jgi:hypothetical protein